MGIAAALLASLLSLCALAQAPASAPRPPELVATALQNELAALDSPLRFRYLDTRHRGTRSRTYEVLETDTGSIEWMVAENGRALTANAQRSERAWLERLRSEPRIQEERARNQQKNLERERRLV